MIQVVETTVGPDGTVKTRSTEFASSLTRAMSAPIPDDGYSTGDLVPFGWAPGRYFCRACRDCGEGYSGDKRCRRCRACAVKALEAERAKPPAPPQAGPEPTDAPPVRDWSGSFQFGQALRGMRLGKRVRRPSWEHSWGIENGTLTARCPVHDEGEDTVWEPFDLNPADILADDWEVA